MTKYYSIWGKAPMSKTQCKTVFKDIMVQKVGNALETKRQQLSKDFVRSKTEEPSEE